MAARTCPRAILRFRTSSINCYGALRLQKLFAASNGVVCSKGARTPMRPFSASTAWQVKKYTEDHEWIELDTDGTTGTIGISKYAAKALGEVVYVELPQLDVEFNAGDTIGAVESVKSASDILTPVTGTIIETNNELEESPGEINNSPEGDAWIAKIKVKNTKELDDLMDKEAYAKFTEA